MASAGHPYSNGATEPIKGPQSPSGVSGMGSGRPGDHMNDDTGQLLDTLTDWLLDAGMRRDVATEKLTALVASVRAGALQEAADKIEQIADEHDERAEHGIAVMLSGKPFPALLGTADLREIAATVRGLAVEGKDSNE